MNVGHMRITKSSADHFLGVVFNEELHDDLCFSPFCRPGTIIKLQSQTSHSTRPGPLGDGHRHAVSMLGELVREQTKTCHPSVFASLRWRLGPLARRSQLRSQPAPHIPSSHAYPEHSLHYNSQQFVQLVSMVLHASVRP